jgi:hypothetical protein
MIFGIQMYHEEMQVKFEYGCCPIIIGEVIVLGLRKLIGQFPFIMFPKRSLENILFLLCFLLRSSVSDGRPSTDCTVSSSYYYESELF